ncbi:unnamed protein product [Caenorhabditis angaria]|uniref:BRCT domain-containing protein n=1 Tax=Caenorhabditis angaria TaxID=860376 RepID=A0A9P1MS04_9PELO|nr:unnamed protein product [Caenorhabditis angaria]
MSIAYDFEPDVSPIYDDEFTDDFSVHFSSYGTPRSRPISNQQNQTMGASRMEMDHSEVNSDEVVPDSTVNSRQYEFEQGEEDDAKVLTGTYIVLSAGCCHPIKRHFLKNLEEMGATIQNHVDFQTTHVVIDRYANAEIVKEAMEKGDLLNMVDVKWIQDCVDKKKRLREKDYSMNDCHYLKQSCRRLSHVVDEHNESDFLNMTTSDLVEFIDQIKSLSERLDALMNYNPLIRFAYHSPDCPTRRRPTPSPAPPAAAKLKNVAKIRKNIEEMSNLSDIKRRRSFGGYVYAHRNDAMLDILRLQEANHDVRETWEPEKTAKKKISNYYKSSTKFETCE